LVSVGVVLLDAESQKSGKRRCLQRWANDHIDLVADSSANEQVSYLVREGLGQSWMVGGGTEEAV
jgi:hypothetical protein